MTIHEFERTFGMYQQSRYERGLYTPNKQKTEEFVIEFQEHKKKATFDYNKIQTIEKNFLEKTKAGTEIGHKTLFRKNDTRTKRLSKKGAKLGGLTTIKKHGKNHMALLSKQIKRGRKENQGFRSKAEMLVANALEELSIVYKYEKPVNGLLPDFQLSENKLLEVMCYSTKAYWKNQKRRLRELRDFEILIVTNKPEFFKKIKNKNIRVVEFSKSLNVMKNRLEKIL